MGGSNPYLWKHKGGDLVPYGHGHGPGAGAGEGIPDLEYRLGQPGVEVGDHLSPAEESVKRRHAVYRNDPSELISVDDIQAIVRLKSEVVEKMVELDSDHSDFWVTHRDEIMSRSILTPRGRDYKLETLSSKLTELRQNGANAKFFCQLQKIRTNYELFGRFD